MYLVDTNVFLEILLDKELARKYGLRIVSYDSDFDATDIGRVTPLQVMG